LNLLLRKASAIATVITVEEIRNMGARNLLDVLKMMPGITDGGKIKELESHGNR
jgi:outer membrane receptor for ferrienterochelin and colicin